MRNTVTSGLSGDLLISFNRPYCRKSFEKARDRLAMVSHRRVHVLNHGHSEVTTTLLRESSVLGSWTMTVSELSLHSDPGYTPGKFSWLHLAPLWRHSADRLPPQTDTSAPNHSCGRSSWKRCLQDHTKHYLPTLLLLVNIKVVFFFFFFFGPHKLLKLHFPTNYTSSTHLAASPLIRNHVSGRLKNASPIISLINSWGNYPTHLGSKCSTMSTSLMLMLPVCSLLLGR